MEALGLLLIVVGVLLAITTYMESTGAVASAILQ